MEVKWSWLIFTLILVAPLLNVVPIHGTPAIKIIAGKMLRVDSAQGWIKVPLIQASGVSHDSSLFYFTYLGANFPMLGLTTVAAANITGLSVAANAVTVTVSCPSNASTCVYSPDRLQPTDVSGNVGGSWDTAAKVYTFTTMGNSVVILTWNNIPAPPAPPVPDSGDLLIYGGAAGMLLFFMVLISTRRSGDTSP